MSFEDDLNTPIDRDWMDVDVALNGAAYTLRFTAMDGLAWANECDKHPMRPGVGLDSVYGYDLRSLTVGVAPLCGARVVDGKPESMPDAQWATLFGRIDGQTFRRISDAIWELNEYLPQEAVKAAKKVLADSEAASERPSSSESPRAGSTAGSRKKPPSTSTTPAGD